MKKLTIIISILLAAGCAEESEPEWMFDVRMCEAEGGFATVQDMDYYTEVTCDYPEPEVIPQCYAICKVGGDCPKLECE